MSDWQIDLGDTLDSHFRMELALYDIDSSSISILYSLLSCLKFYAAGAAAESLKLFPKTSASTSSSLLASLPAPGIRPRTLKPSFSQILMDGMLLAKTRLNTEYL